MEVLSTAIERINSLYPEIEMRTDVQMSKYTSFRIGGYAKVVFFPKTFREAADTFKILNEYGVPILILGNGTNLLVSDSGIDAAVIYMGSALAEISITDENVINAMAGAVLARVAVFARDNNLAGFEFAHGIPGSVGGAVCMNAGAYGGEIKDVVVSVTAADRFGNIKEFSSEECDFAYRHSAFDGDYLVLGMTIRLQSGKREEIQARMTELAEKRRSSQPLELPSAGSTFKRPVGGYAAAMIDGAGLKGKGIGGARVSEKHAGFVVSDGTATFSDVIAVMEMVQKAVKEKYGVDLEPEVRIIR